jgi:RalA-binding protein 1
MLPKPNLALISALSQFLIQIVDNADVNKMTLRNVGIVFAPTLNMPAPVFSLFLTEYDNIFGDLADHIKTAGLQMNPPILPEDVRSPRHQVFPTTAGYNQAPAPTPAYNQTSFFMPDDADAPVSQDSIKANYDTGFVPMQSYDKPRPRQQDNPHRTTRMLDPNENSRAAKAQRRESSMLYLDMSQQRKSSISQYGDE